MINAGIRSTGLDNSSRVLSKAISKVLAVANHLDGAHRAHWCNPPTQRTNRLVPGAPVSFRRRHADSLARLLLIVLLADPDGQVALAQHPATDAAVDLQTEPGQPGPTEVG